MRKKLFTLMTLLLTAVTGAWADPTYKSSFTDLTSDEKGNYYTYLNNTNYTSYISAGWMTYTGASTGSATLTIDPATDETITGSSDTYGKIKGTSRYMDFYVTGITSIKFYFRNNSGSDTRTAYYKLNEGAETKLVEMTKSSCGAGSIELDGTTNNHIQIYSGSNQEIFICAMKVTPAVTGPTITTFTPATGAKVKSGTTVKIDGSEGTTVYYAWSASAMTASEVVATGSAGTTGGATVTTTGIASSATTLYAVAKDGEDVSDLATATYTIDDVAPTLTSSSPANGATDVALEGTITLTFNETISAIDASKFSLSAGSISEVTIDGTDDKVVNVAYTGLPSATSVTLGVAADAVTDEAGNMSAALSDITFTSVTASAPTAVSVTPANGITYKGIAVTLTAAVTGGTPTPTVTWYQCDNAEKENPVSKGTGATYNASQASAGTYYYYAVAGNSEGSVVSSVVPLTVKEVVNNEYYMSEGEKPIPDETLVGDDITMQFVNGQSGESFTAAVADTHIEDINAKYTASISGSNNNNGWKTRFTPSVNGQLSVGIIINKNKTFSITNVTSFKYKGVNEAGTAVDETNSGNSLTTGNNNNDKLYVVVTIDVEAGKTYDFSVAGSKMGFYGFEFTPTVAISTLSGRNYASYVTSKKLDFSAAEGITAYIATGLNGSNDGIILSPIDIVPASTPIIVKTNTQGATINVPATAADASDVSANKLVAGDGTTSWDGTPGTTYYYLASDQFHEAVSGTLKSGKAYLAITSSGAPELNIIIDGENSNDYTTSIEAVKSNVENSDYYNLAGQRVDQPTKGLYIVNGKKVVIK